MDQVAGGEWRITRHPPPQATNEKRPSSQLVCCCRATAVAKTTAQV